MYKRRYINLRVRWRISSIIRVGNDYLWGFEKSQKANRYNTGVIVDIFCFIIWCWARKNRLSLDVHV